MTDEWAIITKEENKFESLQFLYTYIHLRINDVYEASKHNDEIKYIPRIPKVILPKEKHPIKRNMGLLTYWKLKQMTAQSQAGRVVVPQAWHSNISLCTCACTYRAYKK